MPWLLVDLTLGVLALVVVAAVGLRLYRRVRVLTRTVGAASERVDAAAPGPVERRPTT